MRKTKIWMLALPMMLGLASCSVNDTPVDDQPAQPTEREQFEQQLTKTLDNAVSYAQLEPTIKGIEILTSFVGQLDGEAVGLQALKTILDVMGEAFTERHTCDLLTFADLGDREQEARMALQSLLGLDDATQFVVFNANRSIGDRRITFISGQKEAVVTEDEAFVIEYQDLNAGETTELSFKFSDAEDGIILWVSKSLGGMPVAIQFPEQIDFTISTGETGKPHEVTTGTIDLTTTDGTKWFAPKHTAYIALANVSSSVNGRTEDIIAGMTHSADGSWNVTSGLAIDNHNVLSLSAIGMRDRYTSDELEQYSSLKEMGSGYRYAYSILRALNVKSIDTLWFTIDDDMTFDGQVNDVAKALEALGKTHVLRDSEGDRYGEFVPLTNQLNEAVSFTVTQKSTGIKAEGTFLTSFIDGNYLPAPALRFNGEKDYWVMYDRLSQHDLDNYYTLLHTFDSPYRSIQDLVKAIEQKGKEIADVFKF